MSDTNQVIETEIDGKKYKFSGLKRAEDGVLEFVDKEEEGQLDGLSDIQKSTTIAKLFAEHLRSFPPEDS
jgi:hypothetical protein